MPYGQDFERSLTRNQIASILSAMADTPPTVPAHVRQLAMTATIDGLSLWCDVEDVLSASAKFQPALDLRAFVS